MLFLNPSLGRGAAACAVVGGVSTLGITPISYDYTDCFLNPSLGRGAAGQRGGGRGLYAMLPCLATPNPPNLRRKKIRNGDTVLSVAVF